MQRDAAHGVAFAHVERGARGGIERREGDARGQSFGLQVER
jgi:hypothetical protein